MTSFQQMESSVPANGTTIKGMGTWEVLMTLLAFIGSYMITAPNSTSWEEKQV
jgi:hypothetical protein